MSASKKRVRMKIDFTDDDRQKIKLVALMRGETFEECVIHLLHDAMKANGI